MDSNYQNQIECRICGRSLDFAETIIAFSNLPVPGLFFLDAFQGKNLKVPMSLMRCCCGLLQLKENINPELYFYYKSRRADQSHFEWNKRVADEIALTFSPESSVLEVGGGQGLLLKELFRSGFRHLCNVDPSHGDEDEIYFKSVIGQFPDSLSDDRYTAQFDCIVGMHFLEHVPDPVKVLKESCRLLKDNGEVWIEVPDIEASAFESYFQIGIIYPLHLSYFTRNSLQDAANQAGLYLTSIEVVSHYGKSLWAKFSRTKSKKLEFDDFKDPTVLIKKYFEELRLFASTLPRKVIGWGAAFPKNPIGVLILSPPNSLSILKVIQPKLDSEISIFIPFMGLHRVGPTSDLEEIINVSYPRF
jgi:2-polyprenyl-3-methyl-5-hydroxy-6-metoxy-1,4-benzoquinol methylase